MWWDYLATTKHTASTHNLLVRGSEVMGLSGYKKPLSLTPCQSWDKNDVTAWQKRVLSHTCCWSWMRSVWQNRVHCHSHPVGHNGMSYDETAWQKPRALSLTSCWWWDETSWSCLTEKKTITYILLGMRWKACLPDKRGNVTHFLLVMEQDVIRLFSKRCNVTCFLLVVGSDYMKLPIRKKDCCSLSVW